jgi:hypothetical protein
MRYTRSWLPLILIHGCSTNISIKPPPVLLSQANAHDLMNLAALFPLAIRAPDENWLLSRELDIQWSVSRLTHRERDELTAPAV